MDYSSISLINAIIWFFGTITMKSESSWVHPTFIVLLVLAIVMNVILLLAKKNNKKRETISLIVYSLLSLGYLLSDWMTIE